MQQQATAFLAARTVCPTCGRQRSTKEHKALGLRTLFGKISLDGPRLRQCCRQAGQAASISPLAKLVPERSTPELQYLGTRRASLVSYGLAVRALHDFLPVDDELNISTVRRTTLDVARRCEAELGPEQPHVHRGLPGPIGRPAAA